MSDDGTDRRSAGAATRSNTDPSGLSAIRDADSRSRFGDGPGDPNVVEGPIDDPGATRVRYGLYASLVALGLAALGGQVAAALLGVDLLAAAEGNPTPLVALDGLRTGIATAIRYAVWVAYAVAGSTLGYTLVHGAIRIREWR